MGVDPVHSQSDPYVIVDGDVFNYGKSPELIPWSDEKWDPPQWIAGHFLEGKNYHCFDSEEEFNAFLAALPQPPSTVPAEQDSAKGILDRAIRDVTAVVKPRMKEFERYNNPHIELQIRIILFHALKRYHEMLGSEKAPPDLFER